jgi:predicted nucleic acid-binding protein
MQQRYGYTPAMAAALCEQLSSATNLIDDPPPIVGVVPRDPDDDNIVACAVAAGVQYIVSRDRDLPSLGAYRGMTIIAPEQFLSIVRAASGRLPG